MSAPDTDVSLTSSAATKLKAIDDGDAARTIVRLYVDGRTCCSYRYGLAFENETRSTDIVTDTEDVLVVVAPEHREICSGAVVDFVQTPEGEGFTVRTPGSASGCGCGARA